LLYEGPPHGDILKLGIHVAERIVSRPIPKRRSPPSQTWRTFPVSIEFFIVPTAH
jgi:hypothetical protein